MLMSGFVAVESLEVTCNYVICGFLLLLLVDQVQKEGRNVILRPLDMYSKRLKKIADELAVLHFEEKLRAPKERA